jgi:hypothetical protein
MAAYGNMEKAVPGLLDGLNHQIDSRLADGAIDFGDVVCGKGGDQVTLGGDVPLGIVARTALDAPNYPNKAAVNVCRTGKVWANASEAVTADSEVSVNASTGKIIAKTSAAAGAKRVVTITVANASAEGKKVTVVVGDKKFELTTTATVKAANDVAAAIKAGLEGLDIPFVPTVSSAVVTLTAKAKGVNDTAVTAATTDSTQTLTVAQTQAGSDVVANPGWFARSTIDAPGIVLVDMN